MDQFSSRRLSRRGREEGFILLTAIMVIVVMLILAVPFLIKLSAENRSTERASRALAALNLAEAGIDKTLWTLDPYAAPSLVDPERIQWNYQGTNAVGVMPPPANPPAYVKASDGRDLGFVEIVLTDPVGVEPNPQTRTLDSTGRVPFVGGRTVDRTVRVTLRKEYNSIFDVGFVVDKYFYIRNSFLLDAYDSDDGAYGAALSGGGTNSLLPDARFIANSYISDPRPQNPAEASWVIESGGGSSEVYGTIMAGGEAADAYRDGTAQNPPDPSLIDTVVNVPQEDIFQTTNDRMVMSQEFDLPSVDVFDLPPQEMLGTMPSVGEWFDGYNATTPGSATYYGDRLARAPLESEIKPAYVQNTFSTITDGGALTPADNGVYTSFQIGNDKTGGTLNVSGGDVVIYVTSYGDAAQAASFFMGPGSSINIAEDSSLTMILGQASFTVSQGYNINAAGNPAKPADLVVLGTDQFAVPPTQDVTRLPSKASSVDNLRIPGLMYYEHAQSDGNIYAAMYVPRAHVTTGQGQNHMNFFGALIADSMDFKVQVDFHFDKSLADLDIQDGGFEYWRIINWVELLRGN